MALVPVLAVLSSASAALTISAQIRERRRLVYVYKPLATVLILCIALLAREPVTPAYRWALVAGLALSLAGDVFLMLPERWFLAGLAAFLAAHVAYAVGMAGALEGPPSALRLIPFAAYAVGLFAYLRPRLHEHRAPVLVYALVITTMAWLALERHLDAGTAGSRLALAGALLFVASDSALAIDRFAAPFRRSPLVVLGTYYAAQLLLALSV
jgi:uncharacterized membrane protein YhhN